MVAFKKHKTLQKSMKNMTHLEYIIKCAHY